MSSMVSRIRLLKPRSLSVAFLTGFLGLHATNIAAFHPAQCAGWGLRPTSPWSRGVSSVMYDDRFLQLNVAWRLSGRSSPHHQHCTGRLFLSASAQSFQNDTESSTWEEEGDVDSDYEDENFEDSMAMDDDGGVEELQGSSSSSSNFVKEFHAWSKALDQAIQVLDKKRTSLTSELTKAQGVEDTVARAQLLVSNLYLFTSPKVKSVTVQDWDKDGQEVELVLNPKYDSASDEADALFAHARKLKRGSQVVSDLLEQTARAWDLLQEAHVDLTSAFVPSEDAEGEDAIDEGRFALVQDRLKRMSGITNFQIPTSLDEGTTSRQSTSQNNNNSYKSRSQKPAMGTPASNIRKLVSPAGCTVLVGRNRRGNEHLSLNVARGNDIWMHSRGCPGAHVIIFNRRGGPTPTEACLQFGADLAIFYSDVRNEKRAPVSAAEPKHLLKPRGAPLGAIKIRQEWRTFVGMPDQVPEELKTARDQSGQSDEYRTIDKAKHRKRTKAVAKELQAKRRKQVKEKKKRQQQKQTSENDAMY